MFCYKFILVPTSSKARDNIYFLIFRKYVLIIDRKDLSTSIDNNMYCFLMLDRNKTMTTAELLKEAYETYVAENEKFVEKGNKAAAGRARKALMELAKLCKVRRAEILEEKK